MADTTKFNVINSSRVLSTIWKNPGISRIEIAEELGLDRSTITKIMKQLSEKNWVIDVKKETNREVTGRKPIGLAVNDQLGVVLGVEIQTQSFDAVAISLSGELLFSESIIFDPDKSIISDAIAAIVNIMLQKLDTQGKRVLLLGVGVSGIVDPLQGVIHLSNPMNITSSYKLSAELEQLFDFPVFIENDANCCSWGELVYHKGKCTDNFLTVLGEFRSADLTGVRFPGIAVGVGLVIDGEVFYGDDYKSGEFQSIEWQPGLITQFSISNEFSYNIRDNADALSAVFEELVRNLALIINICNFNRVILSSDFVEFRDQIEPLLHKAINRNWVYQRVDQKKISIQTSPYKRLSVSFGAASHALMRIFSIPTYAADSEVLRGTQLLNKLTGNEK